MEGMNNLKVNEVICQNCDCFCPVPSEMHKHCNSQKKVYRSADYYDSNIIKCYMNRKQEGLE